MIGERIPLLLKLGADAVDFMESLRHPPYLGKIEA